MSQIIADGETVVATGIVPSETAGDWPIARQVLAMISELLEVPGLGDGDRAALRGLVDRYGPR
ncbi:hypothetical protein [Sinomonas albida]|uniref:hypothetical protein n=1 Tax=Sinomonas albida TaxID=369942 RepID=UPI0010A79930|nr:hypothetical protein [Sinomonas albida]